MENIERTQEEKYMQQAISQAEQALEAGEGMAFGAVIVQGDKVISAAHNLVNKDQDPTSHAEVNAIRAACSKLGTWNLEGTTLLSTCEPCPMCFSAAWWANISRIVFGVSLEDVLHVSEEITVSCAYLNEHGNSKIKLESGFLRDQCLNLYPQT